MRHAFFLLTLLLIAVILQIAVIPAFLPPVLRPDVGMLMALAVLAFGQREFGLIAIFALGAQTDLIGSARFGLLTVSYLAAAGILLTAAWRELTRGDLLAAWFGGVAATVLAHTLYVLLGRLVGQHTPWGPAMATIASLGIAGLIWGLPVSYLCGRGMARLRILSPAVQTRWSSMDRTGARA